MRFWCVSIVIVQQYISKELFCQMPPQGSTNNGSCGTMRTLNHTPLTMLHHESTKEIHLHPKEFPAETAGRLMIERDHVPTILRGTSLADAYAMLDQNSSRYETINYLYVVDQHHHLHGVFSIKELLAARNKRKRVETIMKKNIVTVHPHTDQERAALLALQHGIKELPIVDKDGALLGVVPFDMLLTIIDQEGGENLLRFGGITHHGTLDDLFHISIGKSMKHRLPWLLLGLLGGLLVAGIIGRFEATLSENLILAAFIPLLVYMASAVGMQMEAFIIRDLAINPALNFVSYFFRQIVVVSIIAVITSITLALSSFLLYRNASVSMVLGIALFLAILSSVFSGLIIPYLFGKLKLDPANASGPVATILQDVLSVLVYFTVASLLLG